MVVKGAQSNRRQSMLPKRAAASKAKSPSLQPRGPLSPKTPGWRTARADMFAEPMSSPSPQGRRITRRATTFGSKGAAAGSKALPPPPPPASRPSRRQTLAPAKTKLGSPALTRARRRASVYVKPGSPQFGKVWNSPAVKPKVPSPKKAASPKKVVKPRSPSPKKVVTPKTPPAKRVTRARGSNASKNPTPALEESKEAKRARSKSPGKKAPAKTPKARSRSRSRSKSPKKAPAKTPRAKSPRKSRSVSPKKTTSKRKSSSPAKGSPPKKVKTPPSAKKSPVRMTKTPAVKKSTQKKGKTPGRKVKVTTPKSAEKSLEEVLSTPVTRKTQSKTPAKLKLKTPAGSGLEPAPPKSSKRVRLVEEKSNETVDASLQVSFSTPIQSPAAKKLKRVMSPVTLNATPKTPAPPKSAKKILKKTPAKAARILGKTPRLTPAKAVRILGKTSPTPVPIKRVKTPGRAPTTSTPVGGMSTRKRGAAPPPVSEIRQVKQPKVEESILAGGDQVVKSLDLTQEEIDNTKAVVPAKSGWFSWCTIL